MSFRACPYKQTGAVTITGSQTVAGPVTIADDGDGTTVDALYLKSEISEPDAPADGEGGILYVKSDGTVYWKSYELGETDLTGVSGQGTFATSTSGAGSMALDFAAGSHQRITLTGNQTGITYSNGPDTDESKTVTIDIVQDGTGNRTMSWPAALKWAGNVACTLSTGANDIDRVAIEAVNDGSSTVYCAHVLGQDMS